MSRKTRRDKHKSKSLARQLATDVQVRTHDLNVRHLMAKEIVNSIRSKVEKESIDFDIGDLTEKIHPSKIHFAIVVEEETKLIIGPNEKDNVTKYYIPSVILGAPTHPQGVKIHRQFRDENREAHLDFDTMYAKLMQKAAQHPNVPVKVSEGKYQWPYWQKFMDAFVHSPAARRDRIIKESRQKQAEKEARRVARLRSSIGAGELHPYESGKLDAKTTNESNNQGTSSDEAVV